MGNVTLWMQMSLDGYVEGPDDEVYWPVVDEELCESFLDELRAADLFLYGRKTYEIMASFWPSADTDPAISPFYVEFARCWKAKPKIVFSTTLRSAGWNTRIVRTSLVEVVSALRTQTSGSMILFGGAQTASTFIQHDLIDQYRLFVHPLMLGDGIPLFPPDVDHSDLTLVDMRTFGSEVVQVHYQHAAKRHAADARIRFAS